MSNWKNWSWKKTDEKKKWKQITWMRDESYLCAIYCIMYQWTKKNRIKINRKPNYMMSQLNAKEQSKQMISRKIPSFFFNFQSVLSWSSFECLYIHQLDTFQFISTKFIILSWYKKKTTSKWSIYKMFENFGKLRTFPSERNTRRTTKWNKIKDMHTLDIMCNVPVDIDKTFETKREIEKKKMKCI